MTTVLGNPPMRLRQLLSSGEGMMRPLVKLDTDPPPKIKDFVDRVIKCPLSDIAVPLSSFSWEYNKGNFHHWRPLFLHFDTYLKTYISCRKDLLLSDENLEEDALFPKYEVLLILRVMQTILENCPNKSSFTGLEHFNHLLASTEPDILLAALQTLNALMKINPSKLHVSGKMIGCGSLNSILLSLAQGWGSKEEGLGLFGCVLANEQRQTDNLHTLATDAEKECQESHYQLASTLHFEFRPASNETQPSSLCTVHIPDIHKWQDNDLAIMRGCIKQYKVPLEQRFSLFSRIRFARAMRSPSAARDYSKICLLAFIALVQSNDAHDELVAFFANEPEFTNELLKLVRSDNVVVPEDIRTLAVVALGAQLTAYSSSHERARVLSGSSVIAGGAGGNRMVLLGVLQKAVISLGSSSDASSVSFVSSLLHVFLLHVISSSSSGSSVRGSGLVPALLPLLQDVELSHVHLVCSSVKILQKLMDYSNAAVSLFRDLGGVDLLIQRLQVEINRVLDAGAVNRSPMIIGDASISGDDIVYTQKHLIKALLKALGSATYAPTNFGRSQNSYENTLPASLAVIFRNTEKFGGDIYFSAVTVMSEIIHKDPTCFPILYEAGLPDAFLFSVINGVLPSAKAVSCIPSGLGAICLNAKGLEAVKEHNALRFLMDVCTSPKYLVAMNEGIVSLANALEELLRHVSTLRSTGVDIIIEIIEKLASMEDKTPEVIEKEMPMETDAEEKVNEGDAMDSEGVSAERFFQLCVFHVMLLVHRTMENAETCRLFVEKKGLEAMIRLLLLPNIAQSSEGLSTSMYTASVFRGFTQHHSGPLAQVFCSSLRSHLRNTLSLLNSDPGLFLLNPQAVPDREMFSSLFVVEYLLFLIDVSKENRWLTALLNEFGNDSKDVLEDIGRLHRDVLWQISVLEDSKVDISASSSVQSQKSDLNAHDSGEQRLSSFRQFLDPLLRRRLSGFGVESQFLDFVSLYNDVSRASGIQRRLGIDALSNMRIGSNHSQLQVSISSDDVSTSKSEGEKQRSFYTSCCDMMRSLCFHVSHIFLELGKVMVLPSRRRDDATTLSPSAKSVLSTLACIILDDLNFGGHVDPSRSEALVSTKCRYIRKIIDFIDVVLLDRPDSCNPIFVNCFYSYGVVQAILTTFEATTQLLFAVNRVPASPMETEDVDMGGNEKLETSWIYGALGSYCLLIDHLVTSSFILAPFTKHLLVQPLTSRSTPRDPEAFVRILQSKVLKTVVPIWNHPHFSECSYEFISAVISIIRHIYSGVEVKNLNNGIGTRISGPPPDESSISMIVEMGFSRTRAEEALRQVGTNSVEMAMEWLFSHPEETQEDDELARALAMSLGNSSSLMADDMAGSSSNVDQEDENVHLPPVDELLSSCLRLLETRGNLAYPVKDLLVMLCSQNDGHHRNRVISFIVEHLKVSRVVPDTGNDTMLSALFHVLALVLHEDATAREVAAKSGLALVSLDLLSMWEPSASGGEKPHVPRWVTASLLSMDRMLQVETKWNSEIFGTEQLKDGNKGQGTGVHENGPNNLNSTSSSAAIQLSASDQKRLVEIICKFIWKKITSETMHVVLQLCATLTRDHSIAVSFLESGGLVSLLSLPTECLFPGFDSIAGTIIRHILEDPQTLQQAMEFEIRHTLIGSLNRHPSGRMTPHNFLSSLASVVCREPSIFVLAAQSVCQIEMVGDRPYVVLLKDREKEKGKDKDRTSERDKLPNADNKLNSGEVNPVPLPGNGHSKSADGNSKTSKPHRKPPQSFVSVIDLLLDSIVAFVPSQKGEGQGDGNVGFSSSMEMDIDVSMNKGKGKAVATVPDEIKLGSLEAPASLAKVVFILKLLSEILLTYSSSVHILLRKDAEIGSFHGQHQSDGAANRHGGIFHHVLHCFLSCSGNIKKDKKVDSDWRHKLATRTGQFLVASAVRSAEGRKRIFTEINSAFIEFVDAAEAFVYRKPSCEIQAFVDLLNEIIAARSPTGSYISAEAASTFTDVGLVQSMTKILQVLDLDHADAPKLVSGIVKALESVTKEHVHSVDSIPRSETSIPSTSQIQTSREDGDGNNLQPLLNASQPDDTERAGVPGEPFSGANISGGSDSVVDDMDHEHDINCSFVPENEDDFMHDNSEEAGGLDNGADSIGISFGVEQGAQGNLIEEDDDEEMSSDGGDEVDEDEDEDDDDDGNDELDEDEVHHLSHPDTDQDDHEVDEDEFDEDVMEEDDEEDENGLILRLEDGINGINVLDQIEVFGRDNFSSDGLHVPIEVLGSRRPGRTTSIYNLLGRAGDNGIPIQHPLLLEPSASSHILQRQSDNAGAASSADQSIESSSAHLDVIFRSLRSGRQGNRLNIWTEDGQVRGGSNAAMVTQSMEEFFVSRLRKPNQVEPSTKLSAPEQPSHKGDGEGVQEPIGQREQPPNAANNSGNESELFRSSNLAGVDGTRNADAGNTDHGFLQEGDLATSQSHGNEMQYERNDAVPRDVEAVSQESGGSGATLGESLRSLEVEIGSVDGHDDAGERQIGDQANRTRRVASSATFLPMNNADTSPQNVSEAPQDPGQAIDEGRPAENQQATGSLDTGSIDPTFLDALPEELRAEVLSSQQHQVAQSSNEQPQAAEEIDPEFLAALPPDIRAEVLAQQQSQRLHSSQELEGQPVEMDTVSIIATFPSDLREEVLLTSSDAILANLTPALVAEANLLRERFAHRYHSRALFGIQSRSRRGESSARGETASSSLDRVGGITSRRSGVGKVIEAGGAPLVDTEALKAIVRILRIFQPLYKGQSQRLLLNLCAHRDTRSSLVQLLMDMLMLDVWGPTSVATSAEPSYRLYGCQNSLIYSRPQFLHGVPPMVSRRVLETLTYLTKNHPQVARLLLHHQLHKPSLQVSSDRGRGKAIMGSEEPASGQHQKGDVGIVLLLSLLNQPLYLRSVAHLEQLLNLLEVIIDNAERNSSTGEKAEESKETSASQNVLNGAASSTEAARTSTKNEISAPVAGEGSDVSTSFSSECCVLQNLPGMELRLLCSLLAKEGLSDPVYVLAAEVLKKLVAIAPTHCHLFIKELAGSVRNLMRSAMDELHGYGESEITLVGMDLTDGTAILRVLQALSSLVSSLEEKEKDVPVPEKEQNDVFLQVKDINATLEPLWLELSNCISKIENSSESAMGLSSNYGNFVSMSTSATPPLPAGTQNILPYIESFFVACEKLHPEQHVACQDIVGGANSEAEEASSSNRSQSKADDKHNAFVRFTEKHRKLLNAFIRQNPGLLEKSFSLMLKVPRFIDFDNKRAHFRSKIKHQHDHHHSPLRISVRRAYILEDSYNQLRMRSTQELKGRLTVNFQGEEGIDAGGLTREWYQLLSRVIFDRGALLFTTVGNESTFQPNPNSVYQTEHLSYFKFVGRVVGKALFDGQLLDVHFTRSFYKHILGVKVTYHDIEAIDPDFFKNLKWMLEHDISDILDLTFSMDADEEKLILYERTEVTDYELVPGGRNVRVTEENKHEYVDLVAKHRLTTAIRPQINAFMEGFNELISWDLISIFNDKELELLISGLPEIDLDDLRANTEYSGYTVASPVIQWFWEVVQSFSKEDKARLLQFVTGTSKVPLEGFSALQGISGSQRFQIHKAYGSPDHLPSAHTCFNQLDLPEYPSKQQLQERLLLAIHEASEGFGFG